MNKLLTGLGVGAILALPGLAHAGVTLGTSAPVTTGIDLGAILNFDNPGLPMGYGYGLPSLDLRIDEVVIQIHALETVSLLDDDVVYLGANAWTTVAAQPLGTSQWEVFGGIGGSLDLAFDSGDGIIQVGPVAPIGVRYGAGPRFGLYVQPALYFQSAYGDLEMMAGSDLIASFWF